MTTGDKIMGAPKMEGYATHSPILAAVVMHTACVQAHIEGMASVQDPEMQGPQPIKVTEMGCGWYSSPMLSTMAAMGWCDVDAWEHNIDWVEHIEPGIVRSPRYNIFPVRKGEWGWVPVDESDVVFVDYSPNSERVKAVAKLTNPQLKFAVFHDTDRVRSRNLAPMVEAIKATFPVRYTFKGCGEPWVTVCSMGTRLPECFDRYLEG